MRLLYQVPFSSRSDNNVDSGALCSVLVIRIFKWRQLPFCVIMECLRRRSTYRCGQDCVANLQHTRMIGASAAIIQSDCICCNFLFTKSWLHVYSSSNKSPVLWKLLCFTLHNQSVLIVWNICRQLEVCYNKSFVLRLLLFWFSFIM